jgi:flagellar biosynthesis protein FlhG
MSDQAEKLRQRMRKLKDPLKDMRRIAIVGAQAHAHVALFSYNLAKALVNEEGSPLIIEEESDFKGEEHLNVLLHLQKMSKADDKLSDTDLLDSALMNQREGVSIVSLPFSQSKLLDQESIYTQLGLFLGKQTMPLHSLFWVQYSFAETKFQERFDPTCQLIVTKGEPTDLVSAYTIIKELHTKNKELSFGIVITQVDNEKQALTAFETLNAVSFRFLEKSLFYCGSLTKSHGETGSMVSDWLGRGSHVPSLYDECRHFIFQKTVTT